MSTYIKQLIDANGNNLIPISGTASCYNSDGLTVDEIIKNLKSDMQGIIPITWAELKALKSSKLLSPGKVYCIIDYKTVSIQSGTTTTGKGMQILVQALSKDTLSEDALGLLNSGGGQDIYLKYSLEDYSRFTWVTQNEAYEIYTDDGYWFTLDGTMDIKGTTYHKWYSADMGENSRLLSTTLNLNLSDKVDYISDITDVNTFQSSHSTITDIKTNQVSPQDFKGVIYYMKDTNNNEAPYDFKNIIFSGHYTFDLTGTDYSSSSYCYENIIKPYRKSGQQILNNIVFLNEKKDEYCKSNYIEPDTHDISYGPGTSDLDTRLILGEY